MHFPTLSSSPAPECVVFMLGTGLGLLKFCSQCKEAPASHWLAQSNLLFRLLVHWLAAFFLGCTLVPDTFAPLLWKPNRLPCILRKRLALSTGVACAVHLLQTPLLVGGNQQNCCGK